MYKSHKDLLVWHKSIELVSDIYQLTSAFPTNNRFGLVDQMRRASISIPSNIAEGYGRSSPKERANFINLARGSASELETQVIVAERLGYLNSRRADVLQNQVTEIMKMLSGLIKFLKK